MKSFLETIALLGVFLTLLLSWGGLIYLLIHAAKIKDIRKQFLMLLPGILFYTFYMPYITIWACGIRNYAWTQQYQNSDEVYIAGKRPWPWNKVPKKGVNISSWNRWNQLSEMKIHEIMWDVSLCQGKVP